MDKNISRGSAHENNPAVHREANIFPLFVGRKTLRPREHIPVFPSYTNSSSHNKVWKTSFSCGNTYIGFLKNTLNFCINILQCLMCLFWKGEADCNHPHNVVWHFMQNKAFKQQNDISFSEVHKRNRSLGENGQSSTTPLFVGFPQLLLGSPPQPVSHHCNPSLLHSMTSPFSSLCVTGKHTMTSWDTGISQSISKWHKTTMTSSYKHT